MGENLFNLIPLLSRRRIFSIDLPRKPKNTSHFETGKQLLLLTKKKKKKKRKANAAFLCQSF